MKITSLKIPELKVLTPEVYGDERGFFLETWSSAAFEAHGINAEFVQDNWSRSARGVLRGLHYQSEHPQGKLVRCTRGAIFDVAVDLRRPSPTFGIWDGVVLSEENKKSLWVPPCFAHGFLALEDLVDVHYKCSDIYFPSAEHTILWDDAELNISWPLPDGSHVQLSEKDQKQAKCFIDSICFD